MKNKYWRYGDTSSRVANQIDYYSSIMEFMKEEKIVNFEKCFSWFYESGFKRRNDSNYKSKDISLIFKTLKWFGLVEKKKDVFFLTIKGDDFLKEETSTEKKINTHFNLKSRYIFRFINLLINEIVSERGKDYSNFKLIPLRLLYKYESLSKRKLMEAMIQTSYFDSKQNKDIDLVFKKLFRKPPNNYDCLKQIYENINSKEIVEKNLFEIFDSSSPVLQFIFKKIIQYELKIFDENVKLRKDLIKKHISEISKKIIKFSQNEIFLLIKKYQLWKNLEEFSDLIWRWISNIFLFNKKYKNLEKNILFETIFDFFAYEKIEFYSLLKFDLLKNIDEFWKFISKRKIKKQIQQIPQNIPFALNEVNLFLKAIQDDDSQVYFSILETKKIPFGTTKPTIFEYLVSLKLWYLIDGNNVNNFYHSINTTYDLETGLPIIHASGGKADATFRFENFCINSEPTLNKTIRQLLASEKYGVKKHLKEIGETVCKNKSNYALICTSLSNYKFNLIKEELFFEYCKELISTNKEKYYLIPIASEQIINFSSKEELLRFINKVVQNYNNNLKFVC